MVSITVCHLVAGGAYSQQTKGSAQGVQAQDQGDDPQDQGKTEAWLISVKARLR